MKLKDIFFANGIFKKKVLIYILAVWFVVILVVVALVLTQAGFIKEWTDHDHSSDWSYKNQDGWHVLCSSSHMQSPIALEQRFAYKKKIDPIKLENFVSCDRMKVENNGYTVTVHPTNTCACDRPRLSGGGLTQNYTLDDFHFHWPSEHTIDGIGYDLETHFVFYAEKYGSLKEALKHPYGITVLAVLGLETNYTASSNFRIIADAVKTVSKKPGHSALITRPIQFRQFLPYDHEVFFKYEGSQTTPNCAEFINWLVFKSHINITGLDLQDLSTIYDKNQELLETNNRSLQNINERRIYMQDVSGI